MEEVKETKEVKKMKKVVKVPVILQMEALECGAASLAMILAYYDKWVPLAQLRRDCGVSRDGSNALNVCKAGAQYGLEYKVFRRSMAKLQEKESWPSIIFWDRCHFVVLDGFKNDKAYINDPARGRVTLSMEEFERSYSGICMTFEPGEAFQPGGKRVSSFDYLKKNLKGNVKIVLLVSVTCTLATLAGILMPVFSRVYTDYFLQENLPSWYQGFFWLFLGVILFQLAANMIHAVYMRRATGKVAVTSNVTFMDHVFRMPMEFFAQRQPGDLAGRAGANDSVAATLTGTLAPILLNIVLLVLYLIVMLSYSVKLTLVGLGTMAVNLILSKVITEKRKEIARTQARDQAVLDSVTVSGISMVETIKSAGVEDEFLETWAGYQASVVKSKVKFADINRVLGTLPTLIHSLSSILIMSLSFWCIIRGEFTAGVFLAFQACMSAFVEPVNQLLGAIQSIQGMENDLERIYDVLDYPEDVGARDNCTPEELEDARKLSGKIELKHVTFGYAKLGDPVIRDLNLTIEPGSRVAFVGSSGCGKSTIAKLLVGLYQPWEGEILFDGKPMQEIPKPVFQGSVSMVDQNVILFQDTIANNIRMWDKTIEDYDMILAARDADIYEDIHARKGSFQAELAENGKDLSGGQRQRIDIARVLAQDPSVIILDEATSALDARTEYNIANCIHDRGITSVVIAHRLSTIRNCDEIFVMDKGQIVQRGKHDDLVKTEGIYQQLVTAQ